jgi:hypothetical protein
MGEMWRLRRSLVAAAEVLMAAAEVPVAAVVIDGGAISSS